MQPRSVRSPSFGLVLSTILSLGAVSVTPLFAQREHGQADSVQGPAVRQAPAASATAPCTRHWTGRVGGATQRVATSSCTPDWIPTFAPGSTIAGAVFALATFDDGNGPALYAAGWFASAGGTPTNSIARWDGTTWTTLGSGVLDGTSVGLVYALAVHDDGSGPALFVGGDFTSAGGVIANNIAKWDGATWSALGSGTAGGSVSPAVYSLASFDDGSHVALYAGGEFTLAGGSTVNGVAKWNGASWSPLAGGVSVGGFAPPGVYALAAYDDGSGPGLYVGGYFSTVSGSPANSIAKWDGASWSSPGSGVLKWGSTSFLLGSVFAMAVYDDGSGPALHAAGSFTVVSGVGATNVAKWNGASWFALGSGLSEQFLASNVSTLHAFDDGSGAAIYAGGSFSLSGSQSVKGVAKWNGASWSALGSGLNGASQSLHAFDDGRGSALFVGGSFASSPAGDSKLAKWGCPVTTSGTSYCLAGTTSSGCVPEISGAGVASASAGSGFVVQVANVEGNRPGLFLYGVSGGQVLPFGGGSASYLCVKPPTQRLALQNTGGTSGGCDGGLAVDWNAFIASHGGALGQPFGGGETVWMQAWFRDPHAQTATNLSDGLVFYLAP